MLARALDGWWEEAGSPDPFVVVDAGAGPGTLVAVAARRAGGVRRVAAARGGRACRPRNAGCTRRIHASSRAPSSRPRRTSSLANELLDNLPFRLLVFDGGWREAHVAVDARGEQLVEVLRPHRRDAAEVAAGDRTARCPRAVAAGCSRVGRATRRRRAERVVAVDYVTPRTAELALSPWRNWLRTYRGHERGGHYLTAPGAQDVTTQVALDQLPEPDSFRTQAQFLQLWGIDELVDEGRRVWTAAAGAPTVAALTMRSRVREADALLDPDGLGGFGVLEWRRRPVAAG